MELVRAAPQSDSVKRIHPAAMQVAPTSPVSISLQLRERVALAGDELRAFEEKRAADEAEAAAARVAAAVAVPSSTGWASAGDQAAAESGPFATPAKGPAARAAAATAAVAGSGTGAGGIAGGAAESTGMGGVGEVSVSVRAEANARGPWNCLCEGFVADEAAAGPMFPFEAEQEHWDAYGEALTARDLAALDAINEAEEDAMEVDRKGTATGDDAVEGEGANAIIPTKIVESTATVRISPTIASTTSPHRSIRLAFSLTTGGMGRGAASAGDGELRFAVPGLRGAVGRTLHQDDSAAHGTAAGGAGAWVQDGYREPRGALPQGARPRPCARARARRHGGLLRRLRCVQSAAH
jgi:hypothetical protein